MNFFNQWICRLFVSIFLRCYAPQQQQYMQSVIYRHSSVPCRAPTGSFSGFVLHFYALYVFSFFSYTMPPGYIFHFSEPWQHHHMTPLLFFIFWMIFLQASLWPILLKACVPVSAYSFIHGRPSWCSIFFESFSTCTFLIIVIIIYRNYYHLQRFVVSAWP